MKKEKSDAEEFMEMEPCKNCGAPVKAEMNEDDDKPTIEKITKMMTLDGKLDGDTSEKIVRTLNKHSEALADAGLINLDNNK